jgi:glutaredoxin 3
MMANVEIYTWSTCPFCIRAKALLEKKGVEFTEYCIDGDEAARAEMAERANGRRTLPQIFINDQHIGGCDDLHALNARGGLDSLLAS